MSAYSRWEDAMIAQTRLVDLYERSPLGRQHLKLFADSLQSATPPNERVTDGFLEDVNRAMLRGADPVYVSADVTDLIDAARETFVPEPVRADDPFTPMGFCLFPRALLLPDSDAYGPHAVMPVRAVSWAALSGTDGEPTCYWISYFAHPDDDHRYGITGEPVSAEHAAAIRRVMPLSIIHTFQWTIGDAPWTEDSPYTISGSDESKRERGLEQVKLIQTIWRIGQQFVRTNRRAPRQVWKDSKRRGSDKRDITVITLRREKDAPEREGEGGVLKYQHIVRGHWHTYNFKDGPRQLWVAPYVKGPEGAELKITKRVYEFTR